MGRISDILKTNMKLEVDDIKSKMNENEKLYWEGVKKEVKKLPPSYPIENVKRAFGFWSSSSLVNGEFKIDDHNSNIINLLNIYFAQDGNLMRSKFPQYSINKGLLITGKCGTGKTLLLKIYQKIVRNLPLQAFQTVSSNKVVRHYDESGSEALKTYIERKMMFDDFGSENKGKHYGKDEEVFKTILEERYNLFIDNGLKTYLTSNLSLSHIGQRYGDRVNSRIHEMFNIIVLGGNDRRLIK